MPQRALDRFGAPRRRRLLRAELLDDLGMALVSGAVDVHFQPKVALSDGHVTGAEVLVRWTHPRRGAVAAAEVVALAEASDLITSLTDRVLERAVVAQGSLSRAGHRVDLAVNMSAVDLLDERVVARVSQRLAAGAVDPRSFVLELTETTVLGDDEGALERAALLCAAGVRLAIDDFGTGFASLELLRRLPVSELKIDRSFVAGMSTDDRDRAIVAAVIGLAHRLGMTVTAEGVEDADVLAALDALGCDQVQGFAVCRPLPFDEFVAWLERRAASARPDERGGCDLPAAGAGD